MFLMILVATSCWVISIRATWNVSWRDTDTTFLINSHCWNWVTSIIYTSRSSRWNITAETTTKQPLTIFPLGVSLNWHRIPSTIFLQLAIGISSESCWHSEAVIVLLYHVGPNLLIVILFKLFSYCLTFEFADVRSSPSDLITNYTHKAEIVVSFALLYSPMVRTFRWVW